jgi:hypothetical protein
MSCLGFQALRLHSLPITGYMTSNDFHSDSWVCAGTSRRREIESEAVGSQPDAIIQNTDTIVLACSAREHVGSHLRHRFLRQWSITDRSACAEKFLFNSFWKDDSKQSEGNGVK